jgi:hypothetical protein
VLSSSCGKENKDKVGYDFQAPKLAPIVDAAAPKALKSGKGPTTLQLEDTSTVCTFQDGSGCDTLQGFLTFAKSYVFQKSSDPAVAAPTYYRYWVDTVDLALSQTKERLKDNKIEEGQTACYSGEAKTVPFVFPIAGQQVTVNAKLFCYEQQTTPDAGTSQDFAFGKDADSFWLVYRTKDKGTTTGKGSRIVIAKAKANGKEADIWFLGGSYQQTPGAASAQYRVNAQRILANASNGSFVFNSVEDPALPLVFASFFANSNGKKLYMEARTAGEGTSAGAPHVDVAGMAPGTGACLEAGNIEVETTGCDDVKKIPATFGVKTPFHSAAHTSSGGIAVPVALELEANKAALEAIEKMDYASKGVGAMPTGK